MQRVDVLGGDEQRPCMRPIEQLPAKKCAHCGGAIPKKGPKGNWLSPFDYKRRKTCSRVCQYASYSLASKTTLAAYFWSLVDSSGGPSVCWPFEASRRYGKSPRGTLAFGGKVYNPSRLAMQLDGRPIPQGTWVLHSCDVGWCCNPSHLRFGNCQDNADDRVARHRHPNPKGLENKKTKLSASQVADVRRVLRQRPSLMQGKKAAYGLSQSTMLHVCYGIGAYAGIHCGEEPLPPRWLQRLNRKGIPRSAKKYDYMVAKGDVPRCVPTP